jgi:hypothetical protein
MYNVTLRHVCTTIVVMENTKYYVFSVCVCLALVIQHAKCMHHIIFVICSVSGSTILFHIIL